MPDGSICSFTQIITIYSLNQNLLSLKFSYIFANYLLDFLVRGGGHRLCSRDFNRRVLS